MNSCIVASREIDYVDRAVIGPNRTNPSRRERGKLESRDSSEINKLNSRVDLVGERDSFIATSLHAISAIKRASR